MLGISNGSGQSDGYSMKEYSFGSYRSMRFE